MAAWGEFGPTPEDVVVLTSLPVFIKVQAIAISDDSSTRLDDEGEFFSLFSLFSEFLHL